MIDLSDEKLNRVCATLQGVTDVSDSDFLRRGVVLNKFYYTSLPVTGGRQGIYLVFRFDGAQDSFDKSLNTVSTEVSITYKNFAHNFFTIEQPFNFEDGRLLVDIGSDIANIEDITDITVEPVLIRQ